MALTYTAAVLQEHARQIEQEIEAKKDHLANRLAVPDYAQYSFLTGEIAGLRRAFELCDEAVKKVNES